jgi:hypothetical protein
MQKSESIKNIATALCSFQTELPIISLDREVEVTMKSGGKYKFSYATIRHIVDTVKPLLSKHKLSYSQCLEPDGTVVTILMHESGEFLTSSLLIKGESNAQGIGSAITYAKRYSLSSILGIIADDDDDGNIAEGNKFETKQEDVRPWMTDKQLTSILNRIAAGELDAYDKADKAFRMKKEYRAKLKEQLMQPS